MPVSLAGADHKPCQRLFELKPALRAFARMGTELLDHDVVEGAVKEVHNKALANLYIHKTDRTKKYLMVASR